MLTERPDRGRDPGQARQHETFFFLQIQKAYRHIIYSNVRLVTEKCNNYITLACISAYYGICGRAVLSYSPRAPY